MNDEPKEVPSDASQLKGKTGLMRLRNAALYSVSGLRAAYANEAAFRQEVWVAAVLIPLACFMPASGAGKALMIGSVLLVLVVEILNTAVEALADRISNEIHVLIKNAKDFGSAAVMLALINVVLVWLFVLFG
jgi:diacylglycerol kinase (ATP)